MVVKLKRLNICEIFNVPVKIFTRRKLRNNGNEYNACIFLLNYTLSSTTGGCIIILPCRGPSHSFYTFIKANDKRITGRNIDLSKQTSSLEYC